MLTHGPPHPFTSHVNVYHIPCVRHVRAEAGLIRLEDVRPDNPVVCAGPIGRVLTRHPDRMSLRSRRLRVVCVSVASPHDLLEDAPDGVEVGLFRFPNPYHSRPSDGSITHVITRA